MLKKKSKNRDDHFLVLFSSSKSYWMRSRDDILMLATVHDDTWNMLNMQRTHKPKLEEMGLFGHPRRRDFSEFQIKIQSISQTINAFENIISKNGRHFVLTTMPWWRHQRETFSALLAFCAGNSPVTGEFPSQRPVTRGFGIFFDLRLNKGLCEYRDAGDLRRYRTHYDVTDMVLICCSSDMFCSIKMLSWNIQTIWMHSTVHNGVRLSSLPVVSYMQLLHACSAPLASALLH